MVAPRPRRQSKKMPLSTIHHQGGKRSSPLARAPAVAAVAGKFDVHAWEESKPPCEWRNVVQRVTAIGKRHLVLLTLRFLHLNTYLHLAGVKAVTWDIQGHYCLQSR